MRGLSEPERANSDSREGAFDRTGAGRGVDIAGETFQSTTEVSVNCWGCGWRGWRCPLEMSFPWQFLNT